MILCEKARCPAPRCSKNTLPGGSRERRALAFRSFWCPWHSLGRDHISVCAHGARPLPPEHRWPHGRRRPGGGLPRRHTDTQTSRRAPTWDTDLRTPPPPSPGMHTSRRISHWDAEPGDRIHETHCLHMGPGLRIFSEAPQTPGSSSGGLSQGPLHPDYPGGPEKDGPYLLSAMRHRVLPSRVLQSPAGRKVTSIPLTGVTEPSFQVQGPLRVTE